MCVFVHQHHGIQKAEENDENVILKKIKARRVKNKQEDMICKGEQHLKKMKHLKRWVRKPHLETKKQT